MDKIKYKQNWPAYDAAKTQELKLFIKILDELVHGSIILRKVLVETGRPSYNLKHMIMYCILKTYFGKNLRTGVSFLKSMNLGKIPHFSSISNYFRNPRLIPVFKHLIEQSAIPLKDVEMDFAVDSSGFSTKFFENWIHAKYGNIKRRLWKKAHITTGVKTNIITSVQITEGYFGDSPMFKKLITRTARNFKLREVSGDKAYSSRDNLQLVSDLGGIPYIPFKIGAKTKKSNKIWKAMWHYFHVHKDEFLTHYHKRSNVESTFSMIKRRFDYKLFSKSEVGQVNEILCKCLCHNLCVLIQELFELNASPEFTFSTKLVVLTRGN